MSDELQSRFIDLWLRVTTHDRAHASHACESLLERYREPARRYHTLDHVGHCLGQAKLADGLLPDADAVELAIWFHDAIYDPAGSDNELRSAALFRDMAASVTSGPLTDDVERLILVTRYGEIPRRDDEAYMADIDYSSFGRPWESFLVDSLAVREERPDLTDEQFSGQQSRFLSSLLERERLYRTEFFHERYEARARSNIRRYLEFLRQR